MLWRSETRSYIYPLKWPRTLSLIFAEIIAEAGIPNGVYNVVTGMGAEIGDDLTSHKDIDFLTFTGSTVVGQHINEICAKNKTPNTLELGGKSPTIILGGCRP